MLEKVTYRESRYEGERTFVLDERSVHVRGKVTFKSEFEDWVALATLDPRPATLRLRPSGFFGASLLFVVSIPLLVLGKSAARDIGWLAVLPGLGCAAASLVWCVATCRKVDYAQFKHAQTGLLALEVARAGPDRAQFDTFVAEISRRVEALPRAPGAPGEGAGST